VVNVHRHGERLGHGLVALSRERTGIGVVVDGGGVGFGDDGWDCDRRAAGANDQACACVLELLVEGVEVAQKLIPANWPGRVQQSRLEHEECHDPVVGRSGACPRGVVVETEVPAKPHHARSCSDLIHRPCMSRCHA
jgi:hypothetical protein